LPVAGNEAAVRYSTTSSGEAAATALAKSLIALALWVWDEAAAPMSAAVRASVPPVAWVLLWAVGVLAFVKRESDDPTASVMP
jgi:hypothetical protein